MVFVKLLAFAGTAHHPLPEEASSCKVVLEVDDGKYVQISAGSAEDAAALSQNAKEKGFHKVLTWKD